MPTIDNQPITRGEIRVFEQGDWRADIATNSSERIPNGKRVSIVAETLTLSGAIVRGDITEAVGRYEVVGRPEWDTALSPRGYRSANSVLLKTVLSDINRETLGVNWPSLVVMPPDANIGAHYERLANIASDAVQLLEVPRYIRNDGITVFGTRPTGTVTTESLILVEFRNDAIGYRVVNCEDVGAFVPGLTFESEVIGEITYALSADDIKMHVWARRPSSIFATAVRSVWRRLFPRAGLQGVFEYVVRGLAVSGRHNLESTGSRWLPDVALASFWTGAAGHRANLPAGTRVGISFMDADPAKPILVCIEPITPKEVGFNHAPDTSLFYANLSIDVDAGTSVALGAGSTPVVVASADLIAYFAAVSAATGAPVPAAYTSEKVKA